MHRAYIFDVDKANELIKDGREPVVVEEESVRYCAEKTEVNPDHLPHVDPARPGIIAHVQYRDEDSKVYKGHALIDGNHRAARCLQLDRPFFAFVLTEEESEAILLKRPDGQERGEENSAAASAER
jgi:hypothetical protein